MKKKSDPRHLARRMIVQQLFEYAFRGESSEPTDRINAILARVTSLDALIQKSAPQWPLDQVNKIDLSILRLALFELLIENSAPPKVIIDEAVELGKEFGTDASSSFINGVLGNVMNHLEEFKKEANI